MATAGWNWKIPPKSQNNTGVPPDPREPAGHTGRPGDLTAVTSPGLSLNRAIQRISKVHVTRVQKFKGNINNCWSNICHVCTIENPSYFWCWCQNTEFMISLCNYIYNTAHITHELISSQNLRPAYPDSVTSEANRAHWSTVPDLTAASQTFQKSAKI